MEPRRSLRLKTKSTSSTETFNSKLHKPQTMLPQNQNKRQKTGAASFVTSDAPIKIRRRQRRQKNIPDMPLDVLFEILSYLCPAEILQLARSTKTLRAILMKKSAMSIWKGAFMNDSSLPPCPSDMCEPEFASLLFGRECNFCKSVNAHHVLWVPRVRCCAKCLRNPSLVSIPKWGGWHQPIIQTIPYSQVESNRCWLQADITNLDEDVSKLVNESLKSRHLANIRASYRDREKHARQCEIWQENSKRNREEELQRIKDARRDDIFAKLRTIGWGEELERIDRVVLHNHHLVKQPRPLTDRIWETIKPELVEFMEACKAKRLQEECTKILQCRITALEKVFHEEYALTQPVTKIIPKLSDVLNMDPFRGIIFDTPLKTAITSDDFKPLISQFSPLAIEWYNSNILLLLKLIPSTPSRRSCRLTPNITPLQLATTFFRCASCAEPISYPRILQHGCCTKNLCTDADDTEDELLKFLSHCPAVEKPWNYSHDDVAFDIEASDFAKTIVTICGQDPLTVTASRMDELDFRVECTRCLHSSRGRLVMKWRIAILHEIEKHLGSKSKAGSWKFVEDYEVLVAKEREAKAMKLYKGNHRDFVCNKCRFRCSADQMRQHLAYTHKIGTINIEGYAVEHLDVSMRRPPYAVRIPS